MRDAQLQNACTTWVAPPVRDCHDHSPGDDERVVRSSTAREHDIHVRLVNRPGPPLFSGEEREARAAPGQRAVWHVGF
ncbi:MAG: hypothetical protein BJ554DRAFT_5515 [Olpidium bornovanus]|uniref:Uncharacterized protein n=1 Tax=Olpidium bornovanus TaxID=278681 RepID=A0A8H8DLF7_9FUNG|nr:MAG: hypothetical protein BJ554DRAFT_5515 [Olpidium bornovanus]